MNTQVENFNSNVAAAFITLAHDGTTAKDDNGQFYEFIRENSELFPGLDTNQANRICHRVWQLNVEEIAENYRQ